MGPAEHLESSGTFMLPSATMLTKRVVKACLVALSLKTVGCTRGSGLSNWWLIERVCCQKCWFLKISLFMFWLMHACIRVFRIWEIPLALCVEFNKIFCIASGSVITLLAEVIFYKKLSLDRWYGEMAPESQWLGDISVSLRMQRLPFASREWHSVAPKGRESGNEWLRSLKGEPSIARAQPPGTHQGVWGWAEGQHRPHKRENEVLRD